MIDALPLLLGPEGYQISRSVRLRSSASAYLNRTFAGSGTDLKRWTVSFWMKRGALGVQSIPFSSQDTPGTGASSLYFIISSSNTIGVFYPNTGSVLNVGTSAVLRDPSAWYHIVFAWDSTQATSTDRIKIYINGVQQTLAAGGTYPSLNATTTWNSNCAHFISKNPVSSSDYFDGYITEINSIDGQALTPSSFGETNPITGVWQPKKYTGTYGTNGFYLNFSDNSAATAAAIGKDSSGNGNNWTPNNISVTAGVTYDSMLDVPTQWADGGNGRGNYATLNPLDKTSTITAADGNLGLTLPANVAGGCGSTIAVSSGQWYAEVTPTSGSNALIGIVLDNLSQNAANSLFSTGYGYYQFNGNKYVNGTASAYGASYAANDVIGIALDFTSLTLTFYKNNVSQGAISIAAGSYKLTISNGSSTVAQVSAWNFGQRPFAYTPPSGFKALNTLNLPEPTILKGNQYFDATLWTGNGGSQTITNSGGMQPDLVWIKQRSTTRSHRLHDSVRGVNKQLFSDTTGAETSNTDELTAFNSDGFTLSTSAGVNANAGTYVGWQWKEGATQGFDIVTYTGDATTNRTVAHALGVQPSMFIIKARSAGTTSWIVHHKDLGNNGGSPAYLQYLLLESPAAKAASTSLLPVAGLSSTTFPTSGATNNTNVNGNGTTYVSYLFSEVAGFSKFGSYTGNNSADGPFVFCGFRPRFVMFKDASTAATDWKVLDTARDPYNTSINTLAANTSTAETAFGAGYSLDILSNGFKVRGAGSPLNTSSATIIYAAFAENPFKNALAR